MSNKRLVTLCTVLTAILFGTTAWSVSVGSMNLPVLEVAATLLGGGDETDRRLIFSLRLPRILVAAMVGAGLAVAGAIMQGIFRNPLAAPDIIGINGGASAAAAAFLLFMSGQYSIHLLPVAAFAGAAGAAALIYALAWKNGASPFRLILIGIGISSAASALTTFLLISGDSYRAVQIVSWLTGTVYGKSLEHVYALIPWVAVLIPLAWGMSRHLDVLALGDATATGVGSDVQRTRLVLLMIGVALAGACVGIAGGIAFIGLMAPHMARRLAGIRHRAIIPVSALLGAILLVLADLAGRTLFAPQSLPAGIFTAGFGAPFFFYLLLKRSHKTSG
ncbi:FecCD family ABC transporter permease [Paenibacillus sambharensis]|uniref:FecCD family ABC transporter permease n=1 Tax=Paenibacillus sambharensis TaxID=1803190 RepID=UPI001FE92E10|nr:iron ABC transporter permease [Paenibacillus sambharensis]